MDEDRLVSEVNRLYWETEASVADIADELAISRRALYDAIEPASVGAECPDCGAPLAYRNRTAQERGEAECPECGLELDVADLEHEGPESERERAAGPRVPLDVGSMDASRGIMLAGALLTGIAVGALTAVLGRRR